MILSLQSGTGALELISSERQRESERERGGREAGNIFVEPSPILLAREETATHTRNYSDWDREAYTEGRRVML